MRGFLVLLLFTAVAGAADKIEWHYTLPEAKKAARNARKPVLAVVFEKGNRDSARLEKYLGKSPVLPILKHYICLRLERSENVALVAKYNLKYSPSSVIYSAVGTPMKLILGPTSAAKYAAQLKQAVEKHDQLWNPKRPKNLPKPGEARADGPDLIHSGLCPRGCPSCGPALTRALRWLVRKQNRNGSWAKPKGERVLRTAEGKQVTRSIDRIDIALTAVSGLALLAEGKSFATEARKAKHFLMDAVREDGVVCLDGGKDPIDVVYAHFETPLAAMFLAEAYVHAPNPELKAKLKRIAAYLTKAQEKTSGAWGYAPDFRDHISAARQGWRLLATTQCCLAAINHLRAAGIPVDPEVAKRAARYLLTCRGKDGLFVYRPADAGRNGHPGTTAAALHALLRSGAVPAAKVVASWNAYRPRYRDLHTFGEHESYFLLFTGLLMHGQSPGAAHEFHVGFRNRLLHAQKTDGHWDDDDTKGGSVFATAVATTVLQLPLGNLRIASQRPVVPTVREVVKPYYVGVPHRSCRVKAFRHAGRYWVDLAVSLDRPADLSYLRALKLGLEGASRELFDVTDGQMSIHRVDVYPNKGRWDAADILISKEFYDEEKNPHPFAHGITRLSQITHLRGPIKGKTRRFGQWIMFPPEGIHWADPRYQHVLAHELCHYLFGAPDEYGRNNGQSYCPCIQGSKGFTELCTKATHTDDRHKHDCWKLAKLTFPLLKVPDNPDPGPWTPPLPIVRFHR